MHERPVRGLIEVGTVVAIYILFVIVGVYGGQTTMNVDVISPADGAKLPSSPVELVARVTIRGAPVTNVTTIFNVQYRTVGQTDTESKTDNEGIARLLVPAMSGNYSWHVTSTREGTRKSCQGLEASRLSSCLSWNHSRLQSSSSRFHL